jgi:hypothetical protein
MFVKSLTNNETTFCELKTLREKLKMICKLAVKHENICVVLDWNGLWCSGLNILRIIKQCRVHRNGERKSAEERGDLRLLCLLLHALYTAMTASTLCLIFKNLSTIWSTSKERIIKSFTLCRPLFTALVLS